MLTRQLNGPDLDCLVAEATFFFSLQMYHVPVRLWWYSGLGVSACRCHDGASKGVAEDVQEMCGGMAKLSRETREEGPLSQPAQERARTP